MLIDQLQSSGLTDFLKSRHLFNRKAGSVHKISTSVLAWSSFSPQVG
jgi:hypothetical protein